MVDRVVIMSKNLAEVFYYARQYDRAIDQYRKSKSQVSGLKCQAFVRGHTSDFTPETFTLHRSEKTP